jgi:hypothetical protein
VQDCTRISFAIGDSRCVREDHVPMRRLLVVASTDDTMFELEEFNHLKVCEVCLATWSEFIHQLLRNRNGTSV